MLDKEIQRQCDEKVNNARKEHSRLINLEYKLESAQRISVFGGLSIAAASLVTGIGLNYLSPERYNEFVTNALGYTAVTAICTGVGLDAILTKIKDYYHKKRVNLYRNYELPPNWAS